MAISVIACQCGSSDKLVRQKLFKYGYSDYLSIPVPKGKDNSRRVLDSLPQHPEISEIRKYLEGVSKYAIVIGYDEDDCGWVDLANGKSLMNGVDLSNILEHFA